MLPFKDDLSPAEREVKKLLNETVERIAKIDRDIEKYQNRGSLRLDMVPLGTIIQDSAQRTIDIRNLKNQKEQTIENAFKATNDLVVNLSPKEQSDILLKVTEQLRPPTIEQERKAQSIEISSKFLPVKGVLVHSISDIGNDRAKTIEAIQKSFRPSRFFENKNLGRVKDDRVIE